MTAPVLFGKKFLLPLLRECLDVYPQMSARLPLNDRVLSLIDDGFVGRPQPILMPDASWLGC